MNEIYINVIIPLLMLFVSFVIGENVWVILNTNKKKIRVISILKIVALCNMIYILLNVLANI